jgi:GTP-binding protein HflX
MNRSMKLKPKDAVLVTYPSNHVEEEAKALAESAGYSIKETVTHRHLTRSTYGIGKGKAEQVREIMRTTGARYLIFDEVLKPTQQYNLANLCKTDIIDREKLILEMFDLRSSTGESKIQIDLAQLHYDVVRIKEKVRLAKKGEQPGFLGLGKYDADVHILDIKRRMAILKKKLRKEENRKLLHRISRARYDILTISIAGYTSAGKTTLFNRLTGESKLVESSLFTTLSTVSRAIVLNRRKVIVSDTVGFISKLPAYLVDAFNSTLQDLKFASLILLVLDVSRPYEVIRKQLSSSLIVMNHLGIPPGNIIYVMNKADLVDCDSIIQAIGTLDLPDKDHKCAIISAKTGMNLESLLKTLELMMDARYGQARILDASISS